VKAWIGSGIAALALGLTLAGGAQAVDPGGEAPRCELSSLGGGPRPDLAALRGHVVLLDFWASWCSSCAQSFRFLNELERDLRGRGLRVLGVNLDEDPADAVAFLARHAAGFELAADPSGTCPAAFGVEGMPSSYLIDRRGIVRFASQGFRPGEARALRALVEELLAEPPGDP
jgi:peroxiredoxin